MRYRGKLVHKVQISKGRGKVEARLIGKAGRGSPYVMASVTAMGDDPNLALGKLLEEVTVSTAPA